MRVAWDLQAVTGPGATGLGVSVRLLLDSMHMHAPTVEIVGLPPNSDNKPLRGAADRICWEQWRLVHSLRREHRRYPLDLLYSPALGAPLNACVPVVAHVHDLIPLRYPGQVPGMARLYWERLLPYTWSRCRALTVSNSSLLDDVTAALSFPAGKIHIVPYYADPQLAAIAAATHPDYTCIEPEAPTSTPEFVMLASHEPRKNIELAIRALALVRARGINATLHCIGAFSAHSARLRELCAAEHVTEHVRFAGYTTRGAVVEALLRCTALLFVSRYEGYGMPPQEAQSIGCAVVLSDIPCHRAVYRDPLRWEQVESELRFPPPLVKPDDHQGLAEVMQRLVEDSLYRRALRLAGLQYQAQFSQAATAHALTAAFVSALS